jgi:serine/threonine protein kinase
LFKQVLDTVILCHKRGIVHRDTKDENLMFDHTNHLKLIDFGGATFLNSAVGGTFKSFAGTLEVAPPSGLRNTHTKPNRIRFGNSVFYCSVCCVAMHRTKWTKK